jgi:TonB family protein
VHKWCLPAAIVVLSAAMTGQIAGIPQSPPTLQATGDYAQSNDGFRAQVDAIVHAYRNGDTTTGRRLIDEFRLENPEEWFSENLGSEQSAKLTERYNRICADFAASFEKTVASVIANRDSTLSTDVGEGNGETPTLVSNDRKVSGMVSIKKPQLFFCHFKVTVKKKSSVSWADTYVYQNGAFRFIGHGGWPFWAWEDGSEGDAPKGGNFMTPAILITKIAPVYPPAAKARMIEGVVVLRLLIDKEGGVKRADVLQGDPLLVSAARDAVLQWRYKPSTLGGAPAEAEVTANVTFLLH